MPELITGRPADYLSHVPEVLQDVTEIRVIAACVNPELDSLADQALRSAGMLSILSLDADGAARWEKILGVTTPLNSSIESRRAALLAKLSAHPPINLQMLKGVIETYMGVEVDVSVQDYILTITYRGETRVSDLTPLYATLYDMIPANLIAQIAYNFVVWAEIKTAGLTWKDLKSRTWESVRKEL